MDFNLVGDFNNWNPAQPLHRFREVTSPYGGDRPDLLLTLGSYFLETTLPRGRIRFKIVQDGSWDHQWSVRNYYDDVPRDVTQYRFNMRHGLKPCHFGYRGGGVPPHDPPPFYVPG